MAMRQATPVGRRVSTLSLVALLHVAIVYALVTGLARRVVEVIQHPIETKIIEEAKPLPPDLPPPPLLPPPKFEPPPTPYIPPPEVQIQQPPAPVPEPKAITAITSVKPEAPSPPPVTHVVEAPPPQAVRVAPLIEARSCEKPEYPSAARRLKETGIVVLQILVGVDGRVISSNVTSSSGYQRLDEAARQALSLCKFKPGTLDGKPVQGWATLRYAWKLEN
jgi:periplasmic protein TonB